MLETIHLQLLLATFAGWVGRQQTAVIAYLGEENRILKEQLKTDGRRLRFTNDNAVVWRPKKNRWAQRYYARLPPS
jgi:hypothetical protein